MFAKATQDRMQICLFGTVLAVTASLANAAVTLPGDMTGQWIGSSLLDGQRETAKTMLDLTGDGDSTLRVESHTTCTLKGGNYTALEGGDAGAWSLAFKSAQGGEACERMTQGKFVLHAGNKPRTLDFDLVYPGRDGASNHRHGMLSHYP
ncbi:MAG: hypothetical protein ABI846_07500 [Rudaea sp.]